MMSSFGLPVPGGHLYLNDVIICTAAILFGRPQGCLHRRRRWCLLGRFILLPDTDVRFSGYSRHSGCCHLPLGTPRRQSKLQGAALGVILGAVIMVVGYSLGRAFIYSTPHYAYIKLPYQILQAAVGAVGGLVLCFKAGLSSASTKCYANNFSANTKAVVRKQSTTAFLFASVCCSGLGSRQITAIFCCENHSASLNTLPPINSRRIELLGITSSSNGLT